MKVRKTMGEEMKVRKTGVFLALTVLLLALGTGSSPARTAKLRPGQVRIILPDQGTARLYLLPFNHGKRYTPVPLQEATGREVLLTPATAQPGDRFNVMVRVRVGTQVATYFAVVYKDRPNIIRIPARSFTSGTGLDIGQVSRVSGSGIAQGDCNLSGCQADKHLWVKAIDLNCSPGMKCTAKFATGGSTTHETITSITFSYYGDGWFLNGSQSETDARSAGASTPTKNGRYHHVWAAMYTFHEYSSCPPRSSCMLWWEPDHWEGGFGQSNGIIEQQFVSGSKLTAHMWRNSGQYKVYTDSFNILGIGNTSTVEYASNTTMNWYAQSGCSGTKYLFGSGGQAWTVATRVYTTCKT